MENPKNGGKNNNQETFIQVTDDNSLQIKLNKPSLSLLRLSQAAVRTKMCTFFGCCLLKYNNFSVYLKIHKNQEKSVPFCLKCTILFFLWKLSMFSRLVHVMHIKWKPTSLKWIYFVFFCLFCFRLKTIDHTTLVIVSTEDFH